MENYHLSVEKVVKNLRNLAKEIAARPCLAATHICAGELHEIFTLL